ncbi:motility associated factor glycosyltransferase family protein [Sulfurimonas sp. SAG-AH-194-C20]|nr:6-hydroxymethylpterin diphosphokinase MptE-like protein [Sulfurimonas sp. SAG-AH-194-C20]MDF1878199.1 motility associated factor glycosyltransferase family protein [Sulfurimonas sp. SAG-AH-194-C20]
MQDINELITNNFNENIKYFESQHPKVFEKLSSLDSAIANGHYKDKYELVYENDGFDVYEQESASFLYNKESVGHTLASEYSVNNTTADHVFEGFARHSYSENELQSIRDKKGISEFRTYTLDITQYIKRDFNVPKELLTLDKFIFFGVGLGLHIQKIHQKIHSQVYFIVEDDLELFRLSLFTLNYKKLSQEATLIFSVFEDKEEFMYSSSLFLDTKNYLNQYIKFFYLLSHSEKKVEDFQLSITSQPHIRFLFNNLMLQYTQPLPYILDNYNILNKSINFSKEFDELPFLVLASGPSLQNNSAWLQKNHHNFITIAVSSSLAYLESINVQPDIILHIDPFEWGITSFEKLESLDFIKESLCLFGTSTPSNIISLIDKEKLFFFETGTSYKIDSLKLSSPCVGSMALQLLIVLKAQEIYLLGLDLAVDTKTGKTHAGEHQAQQSLIKEDTEILSYKKSLFNIAGNFKETVETTPGFYSSIYTIEYFTTQLINKSQTIYNLSNGAKFSHTIPLHPEEVILKIITQDKLLKNLFTNHSTANLSNEDEVLINAKFTHTLNLQTLILHTKEETYNDIATLLEEITEIFASQKDIQNYELSRILNDYLHYIGSYIYDYFNSTNLIEKKTALYDLQTLLLTQIEKLITYYQSTLKKNS